MRNDEQRYFIALVPPDDISGEITAIKKDIYKRFGSKHALRLVPHITLKAPFLFQKDAHEMVVSWFHNMEVTVSPFELRLLHFNAFRSRRNPVIFIEPEFNDDLKELQQQVIDSFRSSFPFQEVSNNELKFHPHITIGYRDLTYHNFLLAWKEFSGKKYEKSFKVDGYCLFVHDAQQWHIIATHHLG